MAIITIILLTNMLFKSLLRWQGIVRKLRGEVKDAVRSKDLQLFDTSPPLLRIRHFRGLVVGTTQSSATCDE